MNWQHLKVFGNTASNQWQVQAKVTRISQDSLTLEFALSAPAAELIWPAARSGGERLNELWQSTCLELFIARAGDERYWEVNLSPSGDWNVYQLDGYRQGLKPEPCINSVATTSNSGPDRHQLQASLALPQALIGAATLQANLCAVLQHTNHNNSYWAVSHPGSQADFHARKGFVLEV